MKKPTKAELYAQLAAQERENLKLHEEMTREQTRKWQERLPLAFERVRKELSKFFGGMVILLNFEHVDASGYWFTFELINDSRRQTYRVSHDEI